MKDSCRVCMRSDEEMRSIFEEPEWLYDKLQFCTGLLMTLDDGKPNQICLKCTLNLDLAHKFKTDCLRSDEAFRLAILQGITCIKKEPLHDRNGLLHDEDIETVENEIKLERSTIEVPVLLKEEVKAITVEKKKRGRPPKPKEDYEKEIKKQSAKNKEPKPNKVRKKRKISLKCGKCQIVFQSGTELSKHKWRNHRKTWICELCGKEMSSSKQAHLKFHQPPQFQCDHCPYKAYDKYDLAKHMRIHLGKKEYICDQCPDTAYHFPSNLRAHIRNVHLKERNHMCDICGKNYFDRCSLKRHTDTHTEIKRYRCTICQRLYARRQKWKNHLLNEHGVTLPRGKPGPKPRYYKESALNEPTNLDSAMKEQEENYNSEFNSAGLS